MVSAYIVDIHEIIAQRFKQNRKDYHPWRCIRYITLKGIAIWNIEKTHDVIVQQSELC